MEDKVIQLNSYKTIAPEDMDSFNSGTIKENNSDYHKKGNGGGSGMDKYATKEELRNLETKIDGQFNTLNAKLDGQFKNTETQFKNIDAQFKHVNSKLNWLFGIIGAVIIAGLSKFFFG